MKGPFFLAEKAKKGPKQREAITFLQCESRLSNSLHWTKLYIYIHYRKIACPGTLLYLWREEVRLPSAEQIQNYSLN